MKVESHQWCFEKAMIVLRNDKIIGIDLLDENRIKDGLREADFDKSIFGMPIKPVMHYFNPLTHMGLGVKISPLDPVTGAIAGLVTNAASHCKFVYNSSLKYYLKKHNIDASMIMFGIALHIIQDLTVPHHSRCKTFNKHLQYEKWLNETLEETPIPLAGGYYHNELPVKKWVYHNAKKSYSLYKYCNGKHDDFEKVRNEMIPLAILSSAGFISKFIFDISKHKH